MHCEFCRDTYRFSANDLQRFVDGMSQTVPGVVTVKKENKDKVLVADDAKCTDVNLNKEVESAFFINILSGGVFGSSTDYGSDKMWKYQDSVSVPCK